MQSEVFIRIETATARDFPELANVLVRAFANDPVHRWLMPHDASRPARQGRLFEQLLKLYQRKGVVYTTEDRSGAALWDPPREGGPSLSELFDFVFRVLPVFGGRAFRVVQGMGPLAALHPSEPHWYLSVIGADPSKQKTGVGSALLRPVLEQCDQEGVAAYLESSRLENVAYYERFGFEVVAPVALPGAGPILYRMKRAPRAD